MQKGNFVMQIALCGVVVLLSLAITSVCAIAIPCNGTVPVRKKSANSACFDPSWAQCSAIPRNMPDCPGSAPFQTQLSNEEHSFGYEANPKTGEAWTTRADTAGTVFCATECFCYTMFSSGKYHCVVGRQVRDTEGKTIDYYKDYYISIGCDIVV